MKESSQNLKIKAIVKNLSKAKQTSFLTILPYHRLKLEELHHNLDSLYLREFINEIAKWSNSETKEPSVIEHFKTFQREAQNFLIEATKLDQEVKEQPSPAQLYENLQNQLEQWEQKFQIFSEPMGTALCKLEEALELINKRLIGESERGLIYEMNKKCRPYQFKKILSQNYSNLLKEALLIKNNICPFYEQRVNEVKEQLRLSVQQFNPEWFEITELPQHPSHILRKTLEIETMIKGQLEQLAAKREDINEKQFNERRQGLSFFKKQVEFYLNQSEKLEHQFQFRVDGLQLKEMLQEIGNQLHFESYIIQPHTGTSKLTLYDVEHKSAKELECNFIFPEQGMGFVHLDGSLIIAGGLNGEENFLDEVRRININAASFPLARIPVKKCYFPLASLEWAHTTQIFAIQGYNGEALTDSEQLHVKLNKWKKLPQHSEGLYGRAACTFRGRTVFAFGGEPTDVGNRIERLDMSFLYSPSFAWIKVNCDNENFLVRGYDGAIQLHQAIIIFGSSNQMATYRLTFNNKAVEWKRSPQGIEYESFHSPVYKIHQGTLYSFSSQNYKDIFEFKESQGCWSKL